MMTAALTATDRRLHPIPIPYTYTHIRHTSLLRTSLRVRRRLQRGLGHQPHRLLHVPALHHTGCLFFLGRVVCIWIFFYQSTVGGERKEKGEKPILPSDKKDTTSQHPPPPYLDSRILARASDSRISDSSCRGVAVMVFPSPPDPRRARYACTSCSPAYCVVLCCVCVCVFFWGGGYRKGHQGQGYLSIYV